MALYAVLGRRSHTRFLRRIGTGSASVWILAATLVIAAGAAAYLNTPISPCVQTPAASGEQPATLCADGRRAQPNLQPPTTPAELAVWAPFALAGTYHAGAPIAFSEDRAVVARSLVPAALRQPWRWDFGDGSAATGWTVQHAYAGAGTWRITVRAYFPGTRKWYIFDQADVTVTGAGTERHS
jgi:hypothetical protein